MPEAAQIRICYDSCRRHHLLTDIIGSVLLCTGLSLIYHSSVCFPAAYNQGYHGIQNTTEVNINNSEQQGGKNEIRKHSAHI